MTEHAHTYRELRRTKSDRMVAGVCGGLGRYFDVNPAFYRVGFVVLALLGGAGILIYFAALLVMPNEGENDSVATEILRDHRQNPWALVALGVLAVAAFSLLSHATLWPHGDAAWVLLLVAGAIILWSQRRERGERPRVLRTILIVLGALIAFVLVTGAVIASIFSVHVHNGVGDRVYRPSSLAAVAPSYHLGIGSLRVDLRDVTFPAGNTNVDLNVGLGNIEVVVPDDVTVHVDADAEVGQVEVFNRTDDGHNALIATTSISGKDGHLLVIDAHVGAGRVDISRAGA
jgi:phage shock protein PspC (stress-responsive transcriptional regulator)/predicted membrane protein